MALAQNSTRLPLKLYLDWGKYDYRYLLYGDDPRGFSRRFAKMLQVRNYQVDGGEAIAGSDYASWRRRTDKILRAFFSR
jgi:hypothetical protein